MSEPTPSIAADYTPGRSALDARPRGLAAGLIIALAILLAAALLPVDPAISSLMRRIQVGGDFKRELETLQQFGAIGSLLITAVIIALVDPARRRTLADLFFAAAATAVAANIVKMTLGRPRPRLADPWNLVLPWRTYPLEKDGATLERHAWEFWRARELNLADLWSMPSSHTSAAVVLAMFLTLAYPRLKPFCIAMVAVVASARVILTAHYPSDVVIGAALGYLVAGLCFRKQLGQRILTAFTPPKSLPR